MNIVEKLKPIALIFILIATTFTASKAFENSKIDNVYADTNILDDFASGNFVNNNFSKERIYKEQDFIATVKDFDKRTFVLDTYFQQNKSPLYGTAKYFVDACNRYATPKDCTTVAAIAMNETHLCTYSTSAGMHNCWGFGGPGIYRVNFKSFEESINKVTDVLANQYGYEYMVDPSLMEHTFCGWEPGCFGWGNNIKNFMRKINQLSIDLGKGDLFSLR